MSLALASAYFSVMAAKCALPAVLPLLTSPSTGLQFPSQNMFNLSPQQLVARQMMVATLAIAVGKAVLGPIIDAAGGVLSLKIALSLLSFLMTVIAQCNTFYIFAAAWIMVDFIFSSCWAASIHAIHQSFPPAAWAGQIGILAAAARTGNASAFAVFATLLHVFETKMSQPWRPIFAVAAAVQVFPVILVSYFGRRPLDIDSDDHDRKASFSRSLNVLRGVASKPDFWLHLMSRSVLMVFASFLLFVPTVLSQVYGTSPALAAQCGSLYALGCLVSVTTLSERYAKETPLKRILYLTLFLGGAALSSAAQCGHMAGLWTLSARATAALFFLWGFSFAVPFYIPPSVFALTHGGRASSATIADVFDMGGFGLLAAFNGYVLGIAHSQPSAWIKTFQMTTACALISYVSLASAVWREKFQESAG